jgi:hypothetical protein
MDDYGNVTNNREDWPPPETEPPDDGQVPPKEDHSAPEMTADIDIPWVEYAYDTDPAAVRAAEVTRTLGNQRADALTDLFAPTGPFTTGAPFDAVRPRLVVVARAETLLGREDLPAELIGYGAIPAALARQAAQDATWQAIYADPATGRVAAVGTKLHPPGFTAPAHQPQCGPEPSAGVPNCRVPNSGSDPTTWPAESMSCDSYHPSPRLQTTIALRDQTCLFPTCDQPAWACDLDHIEEFDPARPAADQTVASNMTPACRRHHRLKTLAGWDWTRDVRTGVITVTSPDHRIYRVEPPISANPPWWQPISNWW